jgi:formate dehydrogenase subunit gamma
MSETSLEVDAVDRAIEGCLRLDGAVLPMLHAIQDELGYVPGFATDRIAEALNLSRAEVYGVVTFYHDFRSTPPGKHVLKVCRAEACQAMGADALVDHVKRKLGCDFHETSSGSITLEPVYCLGNCAVAPSVLIDGKLHGRVTKERFDDLAKTELA